MVSALVIGDPHFKVGNVKETDAMTASILDCAKLRNPDFIVVLGDVLDRHESIHVSPLNRATNFLADLCSLAPTYLLIGNHDLKNNRQFCSDEHPFSALKRWHKNITVVDTTITEEIKGKIFTFVPYVPPGRFIEALNKSNNWMQSACIFAHQEFKGCKMGAIISIEGDQWPLNYPYVVSGHIHDYQEPQVNILYTGTPIQHAFGDRHDKTISYLVFETERTHERIDLGLPKKQIVYLDCTQVSVYMPNDKADLKIIIRGVSGDLKAIIKHPNIDIWKKAGHKIIFKDVPIVKDRDINTDKIQTMQTLRFSQILHSKISNDPKLQSLYSKLFGTIG